jgi:hypothetical protein
VRKEMNRGEEGAHGGRRPTEQQKVGGDGRKRGRKRGAEGHGGRRRVRDTEMEKFREADLQLT